MNYKKVPGERIIAAIIDYIFIQILGLIAAIIPFIIWGFENVTDIIFTSLIESEGMIEGEAAIALMVFTYLGIIISFIWFVIIPRFMNGQTIGKRFVKIKAVNEYGENPTMWQHFVRSAQNWPNYFMAVIGWLMVVDYLLYSLASLIGLLVSLLVFITLIMFLARQDGRGLHDLMAGTWVIRVDDIGNEKFVQETARMSDWVEVVDSDDDGFMEKEDKEDEWEF